MNLTLIIFLSIVSGNGFIPISSLREILGALDDQLTGEQLNEMIAEIDTDQSGTVDFDGKKNIFTSTFGIVVILFIATINNFFFL